MAVHIRHMHRLTLLDMVPRHRGFHYSSRPIRYKSPLGLVRSPHNGLDLERLHRSHRHSHRRFHCIAQALATFSAHRSIRRPLHTVKPG